MPCVDRLGPVKAPRGVEDDGDPVEEVGPYACEDVDMTLRLREIFERRMRELEVDRLFETIEMPPSLGICDANDAFIL